MEYNKSSGIWIGDKPENGEQLELNQENNKTMFPNEEGQDERRT